MKLPGNCLDGPYAAILFFQIVLINLNAYKSWSPITGKSSSVKMEFEIFG